MTPEIVRLRLVRWAAISWSGIWLVALGGALWREWPIYRHWSLFGTWIDRVVSGNPLLLALAAALPLTLPVVMKRTRWNFALLILGCLDCAVMYVLLYAAGD